MKTIFLGERGLRAGWRLLIFVALYFGLAIALNWMAPRLPLLVRVMQLPDLHPVSMIFGECQGLLLALAPTWIMARIERRRFSEYGIPASKPFETPFWQGTLWGFVSTSLLVGLIAAFGGFRIDGLALRGGSLWYFTGLWLLANLLIGFSEELQFRAYLLATLGEGIGFWSAATLLSVGFGALHYFLKPHERWEDFAATGLLGLFMCLTLRRTGSLAFAIGFHFAFDLANLFVWSGKNGGEFAVGHLLVARWDGPQWLTGGLLGPEASWMVFPVIAAMFALFHRLYPDAKFPATPGGPRQRPAIRSG